MKCTKHHIDEMWNGFEVSLWPKQGNPTENGATLLETFSKELKSTLLVEEELDDDNRVQMRTQQHKDKKRPSNY